MQSALDWFNIANPREKIGQLPKALALALGATRAGSPPEIARDVSVARKSALPPKPGLSTPVGQARLLHDLGSIELQAMELGVRTLVEYPDAPAAFREELAEITLGEGRHLGLCLDGLDDLDHPWGTWPVHTALLTAVDASDSLLDRILIVHRYLEGSGLDAGESILKRLNGTTSPIARPVVQTIRTEEVDHVLFGSRWYREICVRERRDPSDDFTARVRVLDRLLPRREKIDHDLRRQAGFTDHEIAILETIGVR